jgi:deoxyadenosine/deoxycytidine kinase
MLTSNDSCHLDLISILNFFFERFHFEFFFCILVYLRAKPEICLERIKSRNRPEEQSITLDYLNQLHERHEEWLASRSKTPVLIVDANQTKEHVYTDTNTHLLNLVAC